MKVLAQLSHNASRVTSRWIHRAVVRSRLRDLANTDDENRRRLADTALRSRGTPGETVPFIRAIEEKRSKLLRRNEPLVDGSLGPAGPADHGVSVRQACQVSKRGNGAKLLHMLVREYRPNHALELGTNVGISAAYQAAALKINGGGLLVTLEASPYRLRLAKQLHRELGLDNIQYRLGLFGETLSESLEEIGTVDYAFIDGHHRYEATLNYFDMIWPHTADQAVVVLDDIRWSRGMEQAWHAFRLDDRVAIAADFGSMGVCVTRKVRSKNVKYVTKPIPLT